MKGLLSIPAGTSCPYPETLSWRSPCADLRARERRNHYSSLELQWLPPCLYQNLAWSAGWLPISFLPWRLVESSFKPWHVLPPAALAISKWTFRVYSESCRGWWLSLRFVSLLNSCSELVMKTVVSFSYELYTIHRSKKIPPGWLLFIHLFIYSFLCTLWKHVEVVVVFESKIRLETLDAFRKETET